MHKHIKIRSSAVAVIADRTHTAVRSPKKLIITWFVFKRYSLWSQRLDLWIKCYVTSTVIRAKRGTEPGVHTLYTFNACRECGLPVHRSSAHWCSEMIAVGTLPPCDLSSFSSSAELAGLVLELTGMLPCPVCSPMLGALTRLGNLRHAGNAGLRTIGLIQGWLVWQNSLRLFFWRCNSYSSSPILPTYRRYKFVCIYTGWPRKNVPNFRMALCNYRAGEVNQQKSMYVMSKHLRMCL